MSLRDFLMKQIADVQEDFRLYSTDFGIAELVDRYFLSQGFEISASSRPSGKIFRKADDRVIVAITEPLHDHQPYLVTVSNYKGL